MPQSSPRPLAALDPIDDRPWLTFDLDPVRLGGRRVDIISDE